MNQRPAAFLDRDGTMIEEVGYLDRLEQIRLFPWTVDAVRVLNRAGFAVIVVTNQAGVARGFFPESFVDEVHRVLDERLTEGGARVDRYYYCPHHPDGTVEAYRRACDCRKPRPGLLERAARDFALDMPGSFVVGDKRIDVQLAHAAGASGVLVRTGYAGRDTGGASDARPPDATVANLMEAASWMLLRREATR